MEKVLKERKGYLLTETVYPNLGRRYFYVYRVVGSTQDGFVNLVGFRSKDLASAENVFNKCVEK